MHSSIAIIIGSIAICNVVVAGTVWFYLSSFNTIMGAAAFAAATTGSNTTGIFAFEVLTMPLHQMIRPWVLKLSLNDTGSL